MQSEKTSMYNLRMRAFSTIAVSHCLVKGFRVEMYAMYAMCPGCYCLLYESGKGGGDSRGTYIGVVVRSNANIFNNF